MNNYCTLTTENRSMLAALATNTPWIMACLCADWCGTCREYRDVFAELAEKHPHVLFIWIDIEDQSAIVGDLDVDDFPTLLIQKANTVTFFGPVLPDMRIADRLLQSQIEQCDAEVLLKANSNLDRIYWQEHCNLMELLACNP